MSDSDNMPSIKHYPNGMKVRELKELIKDWPEKDDFGEDCEVWIGEGHVSNAVKHAYPLNPKQKDDGGVSCDLLLEPANSSE